jgi:N-acetylmuramoyl-L-alanine amidase
LWGYDAHYEGTEFTLNLKKRPKLEDHLKGLRIVIDPGHSPDPGAIGPTGFMEKDANLQIADKLRRELIDRGATVIMTRFDNSPLPLYDRPIIANKFHTDLFISVHNNALPDGVNPFYNNGTSTYYYHPHSFDLARCVQKRVVEASGLPDYGLFHGNFAVIRPTQYPAILVECAFMIIPQQEMELKTESYQKRLAKGIADGVEDFIKLEKDRERREKHID